MKKFIFIIFLIFNISYAGEKESIFINDNSTLNEDFFELGFELLCPSCMAAVKSTIESEMIDLSIYNENNKSNKDINNLNVVNKSMINYFKEFDYSKNIINGKKTLMMTLAEELNKNNPNLSESFLYFYFGYKKIEESYDRDIAIGLSALFGDVSTNYDAKLNTQNGVSKYSYYISPLHGGKDANSVNKSYLPILNVLLYGNTNGQIFDKSMFGNNHSSLKLFENKQDAHLNKINRIGIPIYYIYKESIENIIKKFNSNNRMDPLKVGETKFLNSFKEPLYQYLNMAYYNDKMLENLVIPITKIAVHKKAYEMAVELERLLIKSIEKLQVQLSFMNINDEKFNESIIKVVTNIHEFMMETFNLYKKEEINFANFLPNVKTIKEIEKNNMLKIIDKINSKSS